MKKILSIIAILVLSLILVACGSNDATSNNTDDKNGTEKTDNSESKTDSDANRDSSEKKDDSGSDNSTEKNDKSDSDEQEKPERNTGNNRNSMEKKIAAYLSEIGGPDEISICDGDSFDYEPFSEWSFYGDQWEVKGAKISSSELFSSLDKQLIDGYGFQKDAELLGTKYFKRAGTKELGILVSCESDDDSNVTYLTIYMTHAPECYSMDYIKEQEAKMPDIIPGANALELLPENFYIEVDYGFMIESYGRKDGSYIFGCKYPDSEGWAYAYINNGDGTYEKIHSSNYTSEKFRSEGTITEEQLQEILANEFDFDGMDGSGDDDSGNPSTWGQMSLDFQNGVSFLGANSRFSISATLEKIGTENIAGVECPVCKDDNLWTKFSFAYDPNTGIMFRIVKYENDTEEVLMVVTQYDDNPTSLGTYKG